jgi:hypothetical protein
VDKIPFVPDYRVPPKRHPTIRYVGLVMGAVVGFAVALAALYLAALSSLIPLSLSNTSKEIVSDAVIGFFPTAVACGMIIGFRYPLRSRRKNDEK